MVSPTVLSLTWESPYLGKTVFIFRRGPGVLNWIEIFDKVNEQLWALLLTRINVNPSMDE